jgi:hypothetical protein
MYLWRALRAILPTSGQGYLISQGTLAFCFGIVGIVLGNLVVGLLAMAGALLLFASVADAAAAASAARARTEKSSATEASARSD